MRNFRKLACWTALGFVLSAVAVAGHKVAVLDGTSWKVEVEPDAMARSKGEKQFTETLIFTDGEVTATQRQNLGFEPADYTVTKAGKKKWTFNVEHESDTAGGAIWTGDIRGNVIKGKLIWTKIDGSLLTYTFVGFKLD